MRLLNSRSIGTSSCAIRWLSSSTTGPEASSPSASNTQKNMWPKVWLKRWLKVLKPTCKLCPSETQSRRLKKTKSLKWVNTKPLMISSRSRKIRSLSANHNMWGEALRTLKRGICRSPPPTIFLLNNGKKYTESNKREQTWSVKNPLDRWRSGKMILCSRSRSRVQVAHHLLLLKCVRSL